MLFQLLADQPQALGTILKNTPVWVWGLLAALLALGWSQARARSASLVRIAAVPLGMLAFAGFGLAGAFRHSDQLAGAMAAWLAATALVTLLVAPGRPAAGSHYDAASRSFRLPGSYVPLVLILGIFLTKYGVGVELAMQPALARDGNFALGVAAVYGVFNGLFAGRAGRLLRLAVRPSSSTAATA